MSQPQTAESIAAWAAQQTDNSAALTTSKSARLSVTDIRTVLQLSQNGYTQDQIATIVGCSQSTVCRTISEFKTDAETIRLLLSSQTEEAVELWIKAGREAAKRGDHRPARELIEAAHPSLKPATAGSQGGGGGVTINIGTLDAPIRRPDIEVTEAKATFRPPGFALTEGESVTVSD